MTLSFTSLRESLPGTRLLPGRRSPPRSRSSRAEANQSPPLPPKSQARQRLKNRPQPLSLRSQGFL